MQSFARINRQLNYRLKQLRNKLKQANFSNETSKLKCEINKLLSALPRIKPQTYKVLSTLGWFLGVSAISNGQTIHTAQPIHQQFNLFEITENANSVIIYYQFIDIDGDGDGDQDCFFNEFVDSYYDNYNYYQSSIRLYFQENISGQYTSFKEPELFLQKNQSLFSNLSNIDNDGDWDLFTVGEYSRENTDNIFGIQILSNKSNAYNKFENEDTTFIPIDTSFERLSYNNSYIEFGDIDLDGDEDIIILREFSEPDLYNNYNVELIYLENNGTNNIFPFENASLTLYNANEVTQALNAISNNFSFSIGKVVNLEDIDSDGDKDLLINIQYSSEIDDTTFFNYEIVYFENDHENNRFNSQVQSYYQLPLQGFVDFGDLPNYGAEIFGIELVDIDQDGDIDITANQISIEPITYNYYYLEFLYDGKLLFIENITNAASLIEGNVFLDLNSNGLQDSLEIGINDQSIFIHPDEYVFITNQEGMFNGFLTNGNYEVSTNIPPSWNAVPSNYNISFDTIPDTISNLNFALQPQGLQQDLRIDAIGFTTRRGFDTNYKIKYSNFGTITENGSIVAHFDEDLNIISSDPNATSINSNTIEWIFTNLTPFENRWINVQANVTLDASLGDTLCSVFSISPIANDVARTNNIDTLKQIVIGAFDPNDKLVQPLGTGEDGRTSPDTDLFTYTIRFQNTGTDTAFRVIVVDTLDTDLDISTFEMVATSHPYTFELENRKATWTFDDILLPDSSINNEGSNGYIQYDIKPNINTPLGSQFTNDGYIYFDFNDAVKTNTTLNTFKIALGLSIEQQLEFELFPNPTAERAILKFDNTKREKATLEIYDQSGKLVVMDEAFKDSFTIDRDQLATGAYSFILKVGEQIGSGKLIFTD